MADAGGNAPVGYRRERHARKLVIDPEMAEVVKHVFRIKKEHRRMTLDEIAASLHEAGYVTSTGRKYHRAQVSVSWTTGISMLANMPMTVSPVRTVSMGLLRVYRSWCKVGYRNFTKELRLSRLLLCALAIASQGASLAMTQPTFTTCHCERSEAISIEPANLSQHFYRRS